jgi:hypothetical protein
MNHDDLWIQCKTGRGLRFFDPITGIIYDRDPCTPKITAYSIHNRVNTIEFIPIRLVEPIDALELLIGLPVLEPIKI